MNSKIFLLIVTLMIFTACESAYINTSKNIMHGGASKSINLYAFVGKKISVTEFDPNENQEPEPTGEYEIDEKTGDTLKVVRKHYIMDGAFKCKYQIIKKVFNDLETDTVEFIAYDHYGTPGFAENDSVILYISKSKDCGHYFHQKYQYDNIFQDKNGNYFSYPKFSGTKYTAYKDSLKGFKAILKNEKFDIKGLSQEAVKSYYPKEFYKIENGFAYPIKGIYLYELMNYRLKTTFKNL